jgi:hypothetical protein
MNVRNIAAASLALAFVFGSVASSEAKKAPPRDPAAVFVCPMDWMPVCGKVGGKKQTFSNACVAKQAGAKHIRKGACKK